MNSSCMMHAWYTNKYKTLMSNYPFSCHHCKWYIIPRVSYELPWGKATWLVIYLWEIQYDNHWVTEECLGRDFSITSLCQQGVNCIMTYAEEYAMLQEKCSNLYWIITSNIRCTMPSWWILNIFLNCIIGLYKEEVKLIVEVTYPCYVWCCYSIFISNLIT